ncbi:MAG: hypothetical protein LM523_03680 [Candidatus Contendobacter sp.]|nr:hypothetical protein [Candidatus Contendobacter sp.]
MKAKWFGISGMLAVVLLLTMTPEWVGAQEYYRGEGGRRGPIQVTNDWRDEVKITMWTQDKERIGEYWTLNSGETAFLEYRDVRIKVRSSYKIKVGEDWGWTNLRDVGEFQNGVWYVNVRDIWRATHQDRGRRDGSRYDQQPDYLRP